LQNVCKKVIEKIQRKNVFVVSVIETFCRGIVCISEGISLVLLFLRILEVIFSYWEEVLSC
jgi:hypothetical protein